MTLLVVELERSRSDLQRLDLAALYLALLVFEYLAADFGSASWPMLLLLLAADNILSLGGAHWLALCGVTISSHVRLE